MSRSGEERILRAIEGAIDPDDIVPLDRVRDMYAAIVTRLRGGCKTAAARDLGVSRWSLNRWFKREAG